LVLVNTIFSHKYNLFYACLLTEKQEKPRFFLQKSVKSTLLIDFVLFAHIHMLIDRAGSGAIVHAPINEPIR
jgi:hypothetical protein